MFFSTICNLVSFRNFPQKTIVLLFYVLPHHPSLNHGFRCFHARPSRLLHRSFCPFPSHCNYHFQYFILCSRYSLKCFLLSTALCSTLCIRFLTVLILLTLCCMYHKIPSSVLLLFDKSSCISFTSFDGGFGIAMLHVCR